MSKFTSYFLAVNTVIAFGAPFARKREPLAVAVVTDIAGAGVAAVGVGAGGVDIAVVLSSNGAFVIVDTVDTVAGVTGIAGAGIAGCCVGTGGVGVAVVVGRTGAFVKL